MKRGFTVLILITLAAFWSQSAPVPTERSTAAAWLRAMTLRDRIAQLVIVPCFGEDPARTSEQYRKFSKYVRELHVGGFVVVNRVIAGTVRNAEPHAMASFLNRMQRLSRVPLLMAGDFERGASMRVSGTAKYPHLMAYGAANDPALTRQLGADTAAESRAMGIHWVFAPDADVNNNPDNPIINTRSFGEDPNRVATHVRAFIEGAHSDPAARVLVTVKHFPGHGDTDVDSHMSLPALHASAERIRAVELVPFRAAVQAGVDAVMSAHMSAPALDNTALPATVSSAILSGTLRKELGFKGIIVTDAMDMQGLTRQFPGGEAAVRALEAGADVLLMPPDPAAAISAVEAAVRSGRLSAKRIEESAMRVLGAKARLGLHRQKLVNIEQVTDTIESAVFSEHAQAAADRAITLVRNQDGAVPLKSPAGACFWILAESRFGQGGRRFAEELRLRNKEARVYALDPVVPQTEVDSLVANAQDCTANVVAAFATSGAYKGAVSLSGTYPALIASLRERKQIPFVLVALGSPYLLRAFPWVPAYMATFSSSPSAEAAAVRALLGEIGTQGRMPVSIPGLANIGDGL